MADTPRRRFGAIVAILTATAVLDLLTITAAVAAGTSKFPQPLRIIQRYPWQSIAVLSLVGALTAIWQYLHEHNRNAQDGQDSIAKKEKGFEEISIERSRLTSSAISVARGTRAIVRRSRLKRSPLTVHERPVSSDEKPE
jgi:hypothetical protein